MSEINYEAIGRCKILNEKIKTLHAERMKAIGDLRAAVYALHQKGNINLVPPEIVEFSPQVLTDLVESVGRYDGELMRAVHEYNNWSVEAGEKSVKLIKLD
ncbi:hypothetical protein GNO67_002978 [Yersinia enterocolitica]|uniref:hypothetical protein n=1 Tax=Yersinia enterocolitica TaxID=630 RepID=UPI0005E3E432|nr:hypothetical protein [Yersinia enterocolitica]EKN4723980.1 hypothetical protein [Yersinia enterocolitica]EKN4735020.1 hypothetical protein [Yersinia enterocolitica]CQJ43565.1 Uncharacterised protein [Yersinia enterocolitica]